MKYLYLLLVSLGSFLIYLGHGPINHKYPFMFQVYILKNYGDSFHEHELFNEFFLLDWSWVPNIDGVYPVWTKKGNPVRCYEVSNDQVIWMHELDDFGTFISSSGEFMHNDGFSNQVWEWNKNGVLEKFSIDLGDGACRSARVSSLENYLKWVKTRGISDSEYEELCKWINSIEVPDNLLMNSVLNAK